MIGNVYVYVFKNTQPVKIKIHIVGLLRGKYACIDI